MRRSIYLYLFVFAALIVVFQYASSRKMITSKEEEIQELREELDQQKQEALSEETQATEGGIIRFQSQDAIASYFEKIGLKPEAALQQIEEALISENKASEDNKFVPYAGVNGPMRINRVQLLNQKWVLAEFTDSFHWGELLLSYYFDEEGNLDLETEDAVLYTAD